MSAADRLRSWRSADKDKCRDNGKVRSGGPKARKNVCHCGQYRNKARTQMQIRSKVGNCEQRNGPQSRAKTHQTHLLGGENGAGADTNEK